ncbi:MAG: lipoyl(octanoyl) transferase LipB [Pseudomonadales bacterium]
MNARDIGGLRVRSLGVQPYVPVLEAMRSFTDERSRTNNCDELWFVEHPAVFTQGQAGKAEHLLAPGDIPVLQSDRGGQVTYHGPGQLVGYTLINIAQKKMNVRGLVNSIEHCIISSLASLGIDSELKEGAPGVYVDGKKIASLGLRIRRGCSFHGFSINVSVNKEHFGRINPCGYLDLEVCNVTDFIDREQASTKELVEKLQNSWSRSFAEELGYQVLSVDAEYKDLSSLSPR